MAVLFFEDKKNLVGPGAWGGLSMLISLIAFFVLSIAPIGRRIDKRKPAEARWARFSAWLAAVLSTAAVGVLGAAFGVTFRNFEVLPLFGLVPWARFGAISGFVAGLAGLAAIGFTIATQLKKRLPIGTLLGFLITGLAAASLSIFFQYWDIRPF